MKALLLTITLQIVALSANAVHIPSWDRPIAQSQNVEIIEATGAFADIDEAALTLTRNDGDGNQKLLVTLNKEVLTFEINNRSFDGCNSSKYSSQTLIGYFAEVIKLTFIDHSTRYCKDVRPHQWELSFELLDRQTQKVVGTLKLAANPVSVFTIQSQAPQYEMELASTDKAEDKDLTVIRITK